MPRRLIHKNNNKSVGVDVVDFLQKQIHAMRIGLGQDQRHKRAINWINGPIGVEILPNDLAFDQGAHLFGAPTPFRILHAAKASFILEQDHQGFFLCCRLF